MPSDKPFLAVLLALTAIPVLLVIRDGYRQREIVQARRDYEHAHHRPPRENVSGCVACHLSQPQDHPRFGPHLVTDDLACVRCHRGNAAGLTFEEAGHDGAVFASEPGGILSGAAAQVRCMDCHTRALSLEGASAVREGQLAFEQSGCNGCHDSKLSSPLVRTAPPLERVELTREHVFRYLTEPGAFDARVKGGTHYLSGTLGSVETTAKAMALAATVARRGRSSAAVEKQDKTPPSLSACETCHTEGDARGAVQACSLRSIGTKYGAPTIAALLATPQRTGFPLHPDMLGSDAEQKRVAAFLAGERHPTFEPRWPVMTRALDEAIDAGCVACSVLSDREGGPLPTRLRELGGELLKREGCQTCHATAASVPTPKRARTVEQTLRAGHFSIGIDAGTTAAITRFVDASIVAAKSKYSAPSHDGPYWFDRLACGACHEPKLLTPLTPQGIARALARPPHDYALPDDVLAAIAGARIEAAPSAAAVARGQAVCKKLGCDQCGKELFRYRRGALRERVLTCAAMKKVKLGPAEADDVTAYLSHAR